MARKDPLFLNNVMGPDGTLHLPRDDRGYTDHVSMMRCRAIEGSPSEAPYGGRRPPSLRNYGPAEERKDTESYSRPK